MKFSIINSLEILERTPHVLHTLLYNLNPEWTINNEGGETWSPFDVLGHLIHCDECDWIPRIKIALSENEIRRFEPLDRYTQIELNKGKTTNQLLDEFIKARYTCIAHLRLINLTEDQLTKTAIHPDLGTVNLSQLISTWVAHDLAHLSQISRVMARQYKDEVGPWKNYMKILNQ